MMEEPEGSHPFVHAQGWDCRSADNLQVSMYAYATSNTLDTVIVINISKPFSLLLVATHGIELYQQVFLSCLYSLHLVVIVQNY